MSKAQEEIADPEGYVLQKLNKIDAVHGSLGQNVIQGHLKPDRADYFKQKFEDLREALRKKLLYERKLRAESAEMVSQIKKEKEEIKKLEKAAARDEEMIAIISEDAESSDVEAVMAMEAVDKLLLEGQELEKIRDDYHKKIQEIKREHVLALEPVIARLRQEMKTEEEEMEERREKMNQCRKEVGDTKGRHAECLEGIRAIQEAKEEKGSKLSDLDGVPEKLKKQGDILLNAVKSLRVQVEKWATKVGELNKQLFSYHATIKEKTEEYAKAVVNVHKMGLHAELQEIVAGDMAKDLEAAKAEVEGFLDDQVYLDLQMMGKLSDLKHEQETCSKRLKERDRAILRLQEIQLDVEAFQSEIPTYKQEKKKVHRELTRAEVERRNFQGRAEELHKEIEISISTLLDVEDIGKEIAYQLRESNSTVQGLEKQVVERIVEERKMEQHISELINMRERFARAASAKYALWKQTMERIKIEDNFIGSFHKRLDELAKRHKDDLVLYNVIRSQRNRYIHLVSDCNISIAEMKDKVTPLTQEVENLRGDVLYKVHVLDEMHQQHLACVHACAAVKDDISKCSRVLSKKKFIVEELEVEIKRLEEFLHRRETDQVKVHKGYTLSVQARNSAGLNLIDRKDELCILYEKSNVQVELLRHSEHELAKRVDEIGLLRLACAMTHDSIKTVQRSAPDPKVVYDEFVSLKDQVREAKWQATQLAELCENPLKKVERWRLVRGRDLDKRDLERKAWAIHELLGAREDQSTEKDIILEEVTELTESVVREGAIKLESGAKLGKKINENVRNDRDASRTMIATLSELALAQATAMSLKQEREEASKQLDEAHKRLADGEPPTDDAQKEFEYMEREAAIVRKREFARQALELEEQIYREAQHCSRRPKTTPTMSRAEQRPNAYYSEPFGLPVPFGMHYPFRPSTRGSTMRHIRKPQPPAADPTLSPVPIP